MYVYVATTVTTMADYEWVTSGSGKSELKLLTVFRQLGSNENYSSIATVCQW